MRTLKDEDLTQTVAVYLSKYGFAHVRKVTKYSEEDSSYVRATESLEVTFTPLSDETIVKGRVKSIDAQITKTRAEMTAQIDDLEDQKQRLLAITHE